MLQAEKTYLENGFKNQKFDSCIWKITASSRLCLINHFSKYFIPSPHFLNVNGVSFTFRDCFIWIINILIANFGKTVTASFVDENFFKSNAYRT